MLSHLPVIAVTSLGFIAVAASFVVPIPGPPQARPEILDTSKPVTAVVYGDPRRLGIR